MDLVRLRPARVARRVTFSGRPVTSARLTRSPRTKWPACCRSRPPSRRGSPGTLAAASPEAVVLAARAAGSAPWRTSTVINSAALVKRMAGNNPAGTSAVAGVVKGATVAIGGFAGLYCRSSVAGRGTGVGPWASSGRWSGGASGSRVAAIDWRRGTPGAATRGCGSEDARVAKRVARRTEKFRRAADTAAMVTTAGFGAAWLSSSWAGACGCGPSDAPAVVATGAAVAAAAARELSPVVLGKSGLLGADFLPHGAVAATVPVCGPFEEKPRHRPAPPATSSRASAAASATGHQIAVRRWRGRRCSSSRRSQSPRPGGVGWSASAVRNRSSRRSVGASAASAASACSRAHSAWPGGVAWPASWSRNKSSISSGGMCVSAN